MNTILVSMVSRRSATVLAANLVLTLALKTVPVEAATESSCPSQSVQVTRARFREFLDLLLVHKDPRQAFERFAAPDLIQHNAAFGTSRESTIGQWVKTQADPASRFEVLSVLVDGSLGAARFHGIMHGGERGATVAQFVRFSCGRIAEIWDVFQPDSAGS